MEKLIIIISLAASSAIAQIIVGPNSFDVVFEATNLVPAMQSRIIADINLCRQLWTNSEVHINGYDEKPYIYDGYVLATPYFNEMKAPRELATNTTGTLSLFVSKQVGEAYCSAFEFADANPNVINAANAFVEMICHSNVVCNTRQELAEYASLSPDMPVDLPNDFEWLKGLAYSKPGVMAFGYMDAGPEPSPGVPSNLFMRLQYRKPESKFVEQFECIWQGGKWKFSFWGWKK